MEGNRTPVAQSIKQIEALKNATDEEISTYVKNRIETLKSRDQMNKSKGFVSPNHAATHGVVASRYFFTEDTHKINISGGLGDIYSYYCDINEELYTNFIKKARDKKIRTKEDLCKEVSQTVFDYYGGITTIGTEKDRLSHLTNDDSIEYSQGEKNKLSAFKNTQNAWCVERAVATHQLFSMLGAESELIMTKVEVDEKPEIHALNMVRLGKDNEKETLLIDTTMIDYQELNENNGEYTSIVQRLPGESFDTFDYVEERHFYGKEGQSRSCRYNCGHGRINIKSSEPNNTANYTK